MGVIRYSMSQLLQRKWFGLGFISIRSKSFRSPPKKSNWTKFNHENNSLIMRDRLSSGTVEINHLKGIIIARGITGIGEKMDHPRSGREKIHGGWIKSDEPRFGVIYGQSSSISNFNPNRNWDIFRKQKGWHKGEALQFDVKQIRVGLRFAVNITGLDGKPVMGDPLVHHDIEIVQKRLKGKGLLFQPKKGWGVIKVLSEIDENVPDRSRLVEFLNSPYRDKPGYRAGLRCHYRDIANFNPYKQYYEFGLQSNYYARWMSRSFDIGEELEFDLERRVKTSWLDTRNTSQKITDEHGELVLEWAARNVTGPGGRYVEGLPGYKIRPELMHEYYSE